MDDMLITKPSKVTQLQYVPQKLCMHVVTTYLYINKVIYNSILSPLVILNCIIMQPKMIFPLPVSLCAGV